MVTLDIGRSDSYLASLTDEQRLAVQLLLEDYSLPLREVRQQCPPFGPKHAQAGKQPSEHTLSELRQELRQQRVLRNIDTADKMVRAVREKLGGRTDADTLDTVLMLVGQEVIEASLNNGDPESQDQRTKAAKLLLKQKELKLLERRIELLEREAAKADAAKAVTTDPALSAEEKQARYRQIFGLG